VDVDTRRRGELGETIAAAFLAIKGYEIIETNYRYAGREVDLVARVGGDIVAVEVKLRRGSRFGGAVEAVDARKLARVRTALSGMIKNAGWRLSPGLSPRIDVVAIDVDEAGERMIVEHIVGAS
jgi:putative endonuclease